MKKRARCCARPQFNPCFDQSAMRCSPVWFRDGQSPSYPYVRSPHEDRRDGRGGFGDNKTTIVTAAGQNR